MSNHKTTLENKSYIGGIYSYFINQKLPKAKPDTKRYLSLLYASAANLLSFAGYTNQPVYETVSGQNQKNLSIYGSKGDELNC